MTHGRLSSIARRSKRTHRGPRIVDQPKRSTPASGRGDSPHLSAGLAGQAVERCSSTDKTLIQRFGRLPVPRFGQASRFSVSWIRPKTPHNDLRRKETVHHPDNKDRSSARSTWQRTSRHPILQAIDRGGAHDRSICSVDPDQTTLYRTVRSFQQASPHARDASNSPECCESALALLSRQQSANGTWALESSNITESGQPEFIGASLVPQYRFACQV